MLRIACYARVSTAEQQTENQLAELRRYVAARGWDAPVEYVDHGVSGTTTARPALDRLVKDARRRKFDVLVCWKLDRLGRNLKHLITLLEDLQALGVAFISLGEGIDATTPAGKLQMHILGAIAEFERGRIVERVRAGLRKGDTYQSFLILELHKSRGALTGTQPAFFPLNAGEGLYVSCGGTAPDGSQPSQGFNVTVGGYFVPAAP